MYTRLMARKPTISGRVTEHVHERVDEYAEKRDLTRSQAMGQLLEAGLEAEDRQRRGEPQTRTEAWCRDKFETLASVALLSGPAFAGAAAIYIALFFLTDFPPTHWVMGLVALVSFVLLGASVASSLGAAATGLLLRSGWAQRLDQDWFSSRETVNRN